MGPFSKWKEKVLSKAKIEIKHLKPNIKQHQTKPILCDDEVKSSVVVEVIKTFFFFLRENFTSIKSIKSTKTHTSKQKKVTCSLV